MGDRVVSGVFALVPDKYGITVVEVGDMAARLDDEESLDEAVTNVGFDQAANRDPATVARLMERVRQLNLTGDIDAYWASQD